MPQRGACPPEQERPARKNHHNSGLDGNRPHTANDEVSLPPEPEEEKEAGAKIHLVQEGKDVQNHKITAEGIPCSSLWVWTPLSGRTGKRRGAVHKSSHMGKVFNISHAFKLVKIGTPQLGEISLTINQGVGLSLHWIDDSSKSSLKVWFGW